MGTQLGESGYYQARPFHGPYHISRVTSIAFHRLPTLIVAESPSSCGFQGFGGPQALAQGLRIDHAGMKPIICCDQKYQDDTYESNL